MQPIPAQATRLFNEHTQLIQQGRLAEALGALQRAVALAPGFAQAWYQLAALYQRLRDFPHALAACEQATRAAPGMVEYWILASNVQQDMGQLPGALQCAEQAIAVRPDFAPAYNNKGIILSDLNRVDEARTAFEQATKLDPNYARAFTNLGSLILRQGRAEDAMPLLKRAVALNPTYAHAHYNLGSAQFQTGDRTASQVSLREAIKLNPQLSGAYSVLAKIFREQSRLDLAEQILRQAVHIRPTANELAQLADILSSKGQTGEALATLEQALQLAPNNLHARIRHALTLPIHYDSVAHLEASRDRYCNKLTELLDHVSDFANKPRDEIINGIQHANFYLAYQEKDDRVIQRQYALFMEQILQPVLPEMYKRLPRTPVSGRRIRIGFACRSLYSSTVGHYFSSWILDLDRSKFEIFIYHNNTVCDSLTEQFKAASDHFVDAIAQMTSLAQRIKGDQLDILLYPELGMDPTIFTLASMRLAPIQCCGWGHPVTTGHRNIDYFISCGTMEPPEAQQYYNEKLILLPGMGTRYAVPIPPNKAASKQRADYQLPEDKTLYFYPQSMFKIHPDNDDLVVAVLKNDPQAVLVMFMGNDAVATQHYMERMGGAFVRAGLAQAGRVKILPGVPHDDYKRINQLCDLMLDTLYWSGGNTSLDALSTGLPIVTLPGQFMRGRQSMGMLTALDVPELIATSHEGYIKIAMRLGTDQAWRQQLSARINANRQKLFEDYRPTQALQAFLEHIVTDVPETPRQ